MAEHSFVLWLHGEVTSTRCMLLTLYEKRESLQYIEGPRLEREYMDAVGSFEETVIQEEIEVELLRKKQQMIQTAINRQEPIDEAAIDAVIDAERYKLRAEAAGSGELREYANLTPEQGDRLQELYKDIVRDFHPQMHPELTQAHRQLFKKAQEAYRRRDLEALLLIHEMLYSTVDCGLPIELVLQMLEGAVEKKEDDESHVRDYTTDYALVSQIYGAFKLTSEEAAIQEEWTRYRNMTDSVMNEIERIRSEFPYTAADMLSSPEKVQAYKDELTVRLHAASTERGRRMREIREMLEVFSNG